MLRIFERTDYSSYLQLLNRSAHVAFLLLDICDEVFELVQFETVVGPLDASVGPRFHASVRQQVGLFLDGVAVLDDFADLVDESRCGEAIVSRRLQQLFHLFQGRLFLAVQQPLPLVLPLFVGNRSDFEFLDERGEFGKLVLKK